MSDHTHSQYTAGCYRCDLSRDEVTSGYTTKEMVEQAALMVHRWMCEDSWDDDCLPYGGRCVRAAEIALVALVPEIVQAAKAEAWDEALQSRAAWMQDQRYYFEDEVPNPYCEGASHDCSDQTTEVLG